MATVSQLIEVTRRLVYGTTRVELNQLASAITDTATGLTLTYELKGAVRGSMISIADEIMYVVDGTPASKALVVIRGYMGTTPVAHGVNALVEINARFPRAYIKDALRREIDSWKPRLYRVQAVNIPYTDTGRLYEVPGNDFLHVIDMRTSPYTGKTTRPRITKWEVIKDTDAVASTRAIQLLGPTPASGTLRVRVAYAFDLSVWTDTTELTTLGITDSQADIAPYGAAWRLMSGREIARTSSAAQPEPRRAEENPPGHMSSTAAELKRVRDFRMAEEILALQTLYPVRGIA